MAFVIKQKETAELFTCTLINMYDFPYHGVKVWNDRKSAEEQYASFLLEYGVDDLWAWELCELTESQLKMGNVKLNNDSSKRLFLNPEGKMQTR